MPNTHHNQTILSVQPDSRVVFARLPSPEEASRQKEEYDRATMELIAMIPGWFRKPEGSMEEEGMRQTSMMDYVRQPVKPIDGPER